MTTTRKEGRKEGGGINPFRFINTVLKRFKNQF
jgi:hypothetical protein